MNTQDILKDLSLKAENLFKQLYTLQNEKSEVEIENKQLAENLHAANNQLQRNQIDMAALNKNLESLQNELLQLKNFIEKLTFDKQELYVQLKQKSSEITDFKKNIAELKQLNGELEIKNANLINENDSAKLVIKECELEISRLNELFQSKKKTITKKKQ